MNVTFFKKSLSLFDDKYFNNLRKREFRRLSKEEHIYLDYTGGNLYPETLIKKHHELLKNGVFGNPHSLNPSSKNSTQKVNEARTRVLEFFNAQDDYHCIFTANASAALKIIGECYPKQNDSHFHYLIDNHNSVNGIREYFKNQGGTYSFSKVNLHDLRIDENDLHYHLNSHESISHKLFAYPGQSNASGVKHDQKWIATAQELGWDVLYDAAAFVPTNKLDLAEIKPNYVSISFYKIFGYPTGVGCLLVRKDSFEKLTKKWFAGGTVKYASVASDEHIFEDNYRRFENGTVNYLDLPAVKMGFDFIESIGIERINSRVQSLTQYLIHHLLNLKHDNGEPIVKIYGLTDSEAPSSSLLMTFLNPDGSTMPTEILQEMASFSNISIRTGCFCNPGVDEVNNCIGTQSLISFYTNTNNMSLDEIIDFMKKIRGSIRVSVGYATIKEDLEAYISFIKSFKNRSITSTLDLKIMSETSALFAKSAHINHN